MKKLLTLTLALTLVMSAMSLAAEITGVTIEDYSSCYLDAAPVKTIDESGLNINGPGTHSSSNPPGARTMWLSGGLTAPSTEYVIYDLEGVYCIDAADSVQIWNYNEMNGTYFGVKKMNILVSVDNVTYTNLGFFTLFQAPGDAYVDFSEKFNLGADVTARYIKFDVQDNFADPIEYPYVGLSEVKFFGTESENAPPDVNAGPQQAIQLPNTVTLAGSATDDGLPDPPGALTYLWTKVSGPGTVGFFDNTDPCTDATFSAIGDYVLRLTANDSEFPGVDTVLIKVFPANYNEIEEGVTIEDYSSEYSTMYVVEHIIDGSGLTRDGLLGMHHVVSAGRMWLTKQSEWVADQYVIFDLGTGHNLNGIRIWNDNELGGWTVLGVNNLNINVSRDNVTYTPVGSYSLARGPGRDDVDFSELITVDPCGVGADVRYVEFDIQSNHRGQVTDYVCLAEVIFSGEALNTAPDVNAGDDQYLWLPEGSIVVQLDATVTDDGLPDPPGEVTYLWTQVSGPNTLSFDANDVEDPNVTLTELGVYELQLESYDGEMTGSDTVTIGIYEDACEAAKATPGFELLDGDINEDCYVDFADFALFADNWLKCNSLECP